MTVFWRVLSPAQLAAKLQNLLKNMTIMHQNISFLIARFIGTVADHD